MNLRIVQRPFVARLAAAQALGKLGGSPATKAAMERAALDSLQGLAGATLQALKHMGKNV